jgi:hypothetical protein
MILGAFLFGELNMAAFGSTITWNSVGVNFTNDTTPYMSKTDNGLYLVRFTYAGDPKVIAVRSASEITAEILKIVAGATATSDISTLYTQVNTYITNAAGSIPLENTIGA